MLQLKEITKTYKTGDLIQVALDHVSLNFRDNEFVSILGQSGSGKTTMLNIIGGLDRYESGDLVINGKSTNRYSERDWDTYRNHSIGFVFQSYNLIPHQSVLANVELALTISGISASERKARALKALEDVGLKEQAHKKPAQMSGGQMQRVAIARALVNDPEILLADEPTGALDSATSVQVMELLAEVAKDRLVIMVTHNPELAEQYSTRIVKLKDGKIKSDSNPVSDEECNSVQVKPEVKKGKKKASMSFGTALSLSLQNLGTKKGRTFLTAFAGSIGIIGISLILALSAGVNRYVNSVQKDTMSSYPIEIDAETVDLYGALTYTELETEEEERDANTVYSDNDQVESAQFASQTIVKNNLKKFKEYLDDPDCEIRKYIGEEGISYNYDMDFTGYVYDKNGEVINTDGSELSAKEAKASDLTMGSEDVGVHMDASIPTVKIFEKYRPVNVENNYDLVYGKMPANKNEVLVVMNEDGELPLQAFYQLGYYSLDDYHQLEENIENDKDYELEVGKLSYEDICKQKLYLATGDQTIEEALELTITGIIMPKEDATNSDIGGVVAYTEELETYIKEANNVDEASPKSILIYADNFNAKEAIADCIDEYNKGQAEEDQIAYSDLAELLISSVTTIIDMISYVLIAFVAVSLIVSSIMIGIITYISVLERTKEIGILRAIGASRRNIKAVFNAETVIVGFASGVIGIAFAELFTGIINVIIKVMDLGADVQAFIPWYDIIILIFVSMFLTFIGGIIPAGKAAKKDPVEALRSE